MALSTIGPIDYSSLIQAPDLGGSLLQGFQAGAGIRQAIDERELQRQAMAQQEQYKVDLQSALSNPTPQAFAALTAKYPQQREAFKQSWEMLDKGQQDAEFKSGAQVYSALRQNKPEIALQELQKTIDAHANSGEDTADLENIKRLIQSDPKAASGHIGLVLSSIDPDRWGKIAGELRESDIAPAKLSEAQAKASKAATDAKFAESAAVQDLQKGGWEIQKLANDIQISKLNSQIAAMNAATSREGNDLKRQELQLKVQDKIRARDQAVGEKAAEVSNSRSSIDNFLNTAERVLATDRGVIDSATGPVSSKLPTLSSDTADFEELVNTLGSQAFLSQLPSMKGLGALSEKEGEKLQAALQNLSLRQSPERLLQNVKEAQRILMKSRENLATKYGVPDVTPDTPNAQPAPSLIESLIQKYGGGQ